MRNASRRVASLGSAIAFIALGTTLANPASAAAVACGQVVTQSTTLTADVGPCPGDGIVIGANNITLDLAGHRVFGTDGKGDGNAAGIRVPMRTGVTVRRGTVSGFNAGVLIAGGSHNLVSNMIIRDNIGPGGAAVLGDGVAVFHSAANRLVNNLVVHNGPFDGIGILGRGSDNNVVRANRVERTTGRLDTSEAGPGIIVINFLEDADRNIPIRGNRVLDNYISRNHGSGISNITSFDALISGNTIVDNGLSTFGAFFDGDNIYNGIGIQVGAGAPQTTNDVVRGNSIRHNGSGGIFVNSGNGNRIEANTSMENGLVGIFVESLDNQIIRNVTGNNGVVDLFDANPDCDNNTWLGNVWGPLTAQGQALGLEVPYFPECTANGGNGAAPQSTVSQASVAEQSSGSAPSGSPSSRLTAKSAPVPTRRAVAG